MQRQRTFSESSSRYNRNKCFSNACFTHNFSRCCSLYACVTLLHSCKRRCHCSQHSAPVRSAVQCNMVSRTLRFCKHMLQVATTSHFTHESTTN
jgi:hypothetical protein